ncbi:unnamed protein product [Lactuca saligna]|uniref:Uncharacterized protein n=1 Tax=Lactuca saligna TaxID=75948 RepID=A0AA35XZP9_LACSI|nr:unnamed protein product [Lactuca saligna]
MPKAQQRTYAGHTPLSHDHASCPTQPNNAPVQTTLPKEVDNEGFQTVKKRTRAIPIPKKKVQVNNRKDKGPALKIVQVYKPITHDSKKKNVSSNMFDALSHQKIDESEDDTSIPPVSHPSDTLQSSDTYPSSSHGGHISPPVDQG